MKKLGLVNSWNPHKFVGTIICRDTNPIERYFLFGSRVISGPEPYMNALVMFDVDPRPPLPGKLPVAVRVEVLGGNQ
jgi:hypothetical protein